MDELFNLHTTPDSGSTLSSEKSNYYKEFSDKAIWEDLMTKREEQYKEIHMHFKKKEKKILPPHRDLQFLEDNVFPVLLPILEKTLKKAKYMDALKGQRNLFNGIDYLAERLWNTNVKYPERSEKPLCIYIMPWVQEFLIVKPRKLFPLSWILNKEKAAVMIQSYLRGYYVRRREDVQEMRQFWKILHIEKFYLRPKTDTEEIII